VNNGQKDPDTDAVTSTTGAGQDCSPAPTPVNGNDDLVNALLGLELKSMFEDMTGKNLETITPQGRVCPARSSEEIWGPLKQISERIPPHDLNNPPLPKRIPRNSTPRKMPPANESDMLDRHNRIMAAVLTRFRNMVMAATEPLPKSAEIPQASLNAMTMNNEASALVCKSYSSPSQTVEVPPLVSHR
jgi:hypothetical protein